MPHKRIMKTKGEIMKTRKLLFVSIFTITGLLLSAHGANAQQAEGKHFLIGVVQSPKSENSLKNPDANQLITAVGFKNTGTTDISLSHVEVVSGGRGIPVTPGEASLELKAGSLAVLLFSNFHPIPYSEVKFSVNGSTESIEVGGTDVSVPEPNEISNGK